MTKYLNWRPNTKAPCCYICSCLRLGSYSRKGCLSALLKSLSKCSSLLPLLPKAFLCTSERCSFLSVDTCMRDWIIFSSPPSSFACSASCVPWCCVSLVHISLGCSSAAAIPAVAWPASTAATALKAINRGYLSIQIISAPVFYGHKQQQNPSLAMHPL